VKNKGSRTGRGVSASGGGQFLKEQPQAEGLPTQVGALLAALFAVPLPLCALKVESCSVLRALPHFGQLTFSAFDSTSFS